MRIYVYIKPNSSVAGEISELLLPSERFGIFSKDAELVSALKVSVNSAPVDGQANEELIAVLAKYFKIGRSKFHIKSGLKGRYKVVEVAE